ncbi:cation transporting ATPase PacS [Legionella lansingensis]|uniref:Cation transporting ATPase PacS n=1 Tax=Legionella lansingensis TaxID=45067 RepID=A0A0W0VUV9_9GAMM|nr:HAD-IC family P-type ATPase [Legionella lansingensis]KTD23765.1 cation transporting ATPase PacS [Legionella lansingensis]SNV47422.1 cation transporting ATPase PacS [Legionella lansingensis]
MSILYEFYIPNITCSSCVASILSAFQAEDFSSKTGLEIESHYLNHNEKILKIKVNSLNKKPADIKKILYQTIMELGFDCADITSAATTVKASNKGFLNSHLFLGSLGTGTGVALLILSLMVTGGLSLPLMITIATISTLLTVLLGAPFYYQAAKKFLASRTMTMDTLFTVSTVTVLIVSVAAFVLPWLPMMFEAGLLIFGFRHLGLAIEKSISEKFILEKKFKDRLPVEVDVCMAETMELKRRKLATLQPGEVILLRGGDLIPIDGEALDDCVIYDTIVTGSVLPRLIKRGEKVLAGMRLVEDAPSLQLKISPITLSLEKDDTVPVDGICCENCIIYDEESNEPRLVEKGQPLLVGTRLASCAKLQITAVANYSYLHRLDHSNEQAQFKKAPIEEATTQILQYFIPSIIVLAIISGVIVSLFFSPALAIQCAVSVLVAACPCTLGLITPLAIKIGINKAAEHGVQFKSAKDLQAADRIDAVVLDVHGTITTGAPEVSHYAYNAALSSEEEIFSYFAALEEKSQHPIAKAIAHFVKDKTLEPLTVKTFDQSNHSGIKAQITRETPMLEKGEMALEEEVIIGNQTMMQECGIDVSAAHRKIDLKEGQSVVYLARNKQLLGYMVLIDPLRSGVRETVAALKQMGIRVFICTGADQATALRYARLLDIPEEDIAFACVGISEDSDDNSKPAFIKKLQAQGFYVAMVGDAGNDAAALAQTFGIAIKSKSGDEVAQQQASAVVQSDSLLPVANTFAIARQTVANIKQNLGFSLAYNMASVLLAGGLLVAIGLTLNPAVGVALMILQTCLILLNAYRFKAQEPEHLQQLSVQDIKEYKESYGCFDRLFNVEKSSSLDKEVRPVDVEYSESLFKQRPNNLEISVGVDAVKAYTF